MKYKFETRKSILSDGRQSKCKCAPKTIAANAMISTMSNWMLALLLLLLVQINFSRSNEYPSVTETASQVGDKCDNNVIDAGATTDGDCLLGVSRNVEPSENATDTENRIDQKRLDIPYAASENSEIDEVINKATEECLKSCDTEASTFINEYGLDCHKNDNNDLCFANRCTKGCELWWKGFNNSEQCAETCISTQFYSLDLPCISACEYGHKRYWDLHKSILTQAAQLIKPYISTSNTLTNPIHIEWKIQLPHMYFENHEFCIQYQYIRSNNASPIKPDELSWKNSASYDCNQIFDCEIFDDLMPYSSYKFRFKLHFGDDEEDVLYSPSTDVFNMPANGPPISAPVLESAYALDHSHIVAFWQPGQFPNGPLTSYKIKLHNDSYTFEEILEPTKQSHIFNGLSSATNYTLKLAILNELGEGPFIERNVLTKPESIYDDSNDIEQILIAGEYSIRLKSMDRLFETKVIFQSEELISDYAVYAAEERLFIVDVTGNINSISLRDNIQKDIIRLPSNLMDFKTKKITVDWLNKELFLAGERLGHKWTLIKVDFTGKHSAILTEELTMPIEYLDVDPINGWLFWRQGNGLFRMDLTQKNLEVVVRSPTVGHFFNDYESTLIVMYNRSGNTFYELTYDGSYIKGLLPNAPATLSGDIQSFIYLGANFLATNGTHIISQNLRSNKTAIWPVKEVEWCWSFLPLTQMHETQPQTTQSKPPKNLHALLSTNLAKITWDAPSRRAFQSAYAWQGWEYELEIMDVASNSAFNIRNIKTKYFNVEKLQPNNLYKFRVRISGQRHSHSHSQSQIQSPSPSQSQSHSEEGEWSDTLLMRTWPLGVHKFLFASANGLYEMNEVGEQIREIARMQNVHEFLQLNGTIYFISKDKRVQCANIMNPEINCAFTAANAVSLTYDWRGGKIYWIDTSRSGVLRANLDGSERELLPIFGARNIEIDADNGNIYYTNGMKLVRCALGYALTMNEHEYYQVTTFDDVIRDFAFDLAGRRIFWVVCTSDGQIQLLYNNLESNSDSIKSVALEQDIEAGTLQFLQEIDSLMWVPKNSSKIVLARTSNLTNKAYIDLPQYGKIKSVHLHREITPYMDLSVIPDAVDSNTLYVNADYIDDLNIKWAPVVTAENYTVFYNVLVAYNETGLTNLYATTTNHTSVNIEGLNWLKQPFNVTITPYTSWIMGAPTVAQLRTTTLPPADPRQLRVFSVYIDDPLQSAPSVSAIIRWAPPENITSSMETTYKIQCWSNGDLLKEIIHNSSENLHLETNIANITIGQLYTFQVQAMDATRLQGGQKAVIQARIDPELQSLPHFFFATTKHIAEFDLDLDKQNIIVNTTNEVEHLIAIIGEKRLIWVNENVELISYVMGDKPVKLARMRAEVLSLTVDWIQRIVYWAEMDTDDEQTVCIYKLDLCKFEGRIMFPEKLFALEKHQILKDLTIFPFTNTLVWLAYHSHDKHINATIMVRNLNNSSLQALQTGPFVKMYAVLLSSNKEAVNLIDIDGNNCLYVLQNPACERQTKLFNRTTEVNTIDSDSGFIYVASNQHVYTFNKQTQALSYEKDIANLKHIKAHSLQKLPERRCLSPEATLFLNNSDLLNPIPQTLSERFLTLHFPKVHLIQNCSTQIPGLSYILFITDNYNQTRNYTCIDNVFKVSDLQPYTKYDIQLAITSYYQRKLKRPILYSEVFGVRTDIGTPTQPENFIAYAISPTQVRVSWLPPLQMNADNVWYQLHWQLQDSALGAHKRLNATAFTITNLIPMQNYTTWLQVFSTDTKFNATSWIYVRTFDEPNKLTLVDRTAYNITLNWPQSSNVTRTVLVCRQINGDNEFSIDVPLNSNTTYVNVPDLEPKTKYEFYLEIYYGTDMDPYMWPELPNEWFMYETIGDVPGRPGQPQIEHITNQIFKVFWEPAKNNGEPITTYSLEALQAHTTRRVKRDSGNNQMTATATLANLTQLLWAEEPKPVEDKWIIICNTSQQSCIVRELHNLRLLMFRVRARNDLYGWGEYSLESERIAEPFVSPEKRESLVLAIILPATIVSSCVLVLVIIRAIQIRRTKARKLLAKSRPSIWSTISTIQQQQQLMGAQNRAFSLTSHSTLYTGGPLSDADIALLPHINWHQITLLNFLGSGAFGEVYEGLIAYENGGEQQKVAIKSLRKGSNEFAELLQEAQLMSNFKHENIVSLIGVCCDAESISIIMEHMEAGDLLSYLRESRPNSKKPVVTLKLLDLITMCVDVAQGCSYLEDMHFVHRDLACRNCLVSSYDPAKRVVKIGDFGLARDIYKNDYYRKEGEGLLPVRWMAPECLMDGIFTTQSDVWAFAVLCWEILTLGQQPYAARNNYDVLNYVKEGGRLEQPQNCPDKLFTLMSQCWCVQPDERPTFRRCLSTLISVKTDVRRFSLAFNSNDSNADFALYANSLPTVMEETTGEPQTLNENNDLKCNLENFCQDVDIETVSDDSQLIESELSSLKAAPTCYLNEGVSRF